LRPLIREANLYHISPRPDGVHWDGMEYWDPGRRHGVVFAFHGSIATEPSHSFPLKGLRTDARYTVHFRDHSGPDLVVAGRELMSGGLKVDLPLSQSSELIFIEEVTR